MRYICSPKVRGRWHAKVVDPGVPHGSLTNVVDRQLSSLPSFKTFSKVSGWTFITHRTERKPFSNRQTTFLFICEWYNVQLGWEPMDEVFFLFFFFFAGVGQWPHLNISGRQTGPSSPPGTNNHFVIRKDGIIMLILSIRVQGMS